MFILIKVVSHYVSQIALFSCVNQILRFININMVHVHVHEIYETSKQVLGVQL